MLSFYGTSFRVILFTVPIIESNDIEINEDGGIATVVVNLLNEIENDFVLEYKTVEVLDGADGMINLHKMYV